MTHEEVLNEEKNLEENLKYKTVTATLKRIRRMFKTRRVLTC